MMIDKYNLRNAIIWLCHNKLEIAGIISICLIMYVWGMFTITDHIFPYSQLRTTKHLIIPQKTLNGGCDHYYIGRKISLFSIISRQSRVVMIGDSITEGAEWDELFPKVSIANRGVYCDTTIGILHRMNSIYSVNPKMAFIMIGVNDLEHGDSLDIIIINYKKIIEQLVTRNIDVVIQATLECNNTYSACLWLLPRIRDLNANLRGIANSKNIIFVDLNKSLAGEDGLKNEYTNDGQHLNGKGYLAWSQEISSLINR